MTVWATALLPAALLLRRRPEDMGQLPDGEVLLVETVADVATLAPRDPERLAFVTQTTLSVDDTRDIVEALRALSAKFGGGWVVLKGQHTLIGRAEGEGFVNPTGNPALGQGGSGDLLAGYLAGLLAQPLLREDIGRTIRYAAWQHGAAAEELAAQAPNWVVEDLAKRIGGVLAVSSEQ